MVPSAAMAAAPTGETYYERRKLLIAAGEQARIRVQAVAQPLHSGESYEHQADRRSCQLRLLHLFVMAGLNRAAKGSPMTSYFLEGKQSIPLTLEDVRALLADGCLQANDRLRRDSEQTFLCISEIPELTQGPRTDSVSIPPPRSNSPLLPPPRTGSVSLAPPAVSVPAQAPTEPPPRPVRQPEPMAAPMPEKSNAPARLGPRTVAELARLSRPTLQATALPDPAATPVAVKPLAQQPSSPPVSVASTPAPREPSPPSVPVSVDTAPEHRRRSHWTLLAVGVAALLCIAALVALIARRGAQTAPPVPPAPRPPAREAFTPPPAAAPPTPEPGIVPTQAEPSSPAAAPPTPEPDIVPSQAEPSSPTEPETADVVHRHRERAARAKRTVEKREREKASPTSNPPLSGTSSKTGEVPPRLAPSSAP